MSKQELTKKRKTKMEFWTKTEMENQNIQCQVILDDKCHI